MKNKIIKILSLAVVILFFGTNIYANTLGDYDGDDEVTSFDAYMALEMSNLDREFTQAELNDLDVDKDGEITSFDAYLILSYSIGIDENGYWNTPEPEPDPDPKPVEDIFDKYYNPVESKYYYNQLNDGEKAIYDTLYDNKDELKNAEKMGVNYTYDTFEMDINTTYMNVYYAYKYDNPDTFYMRTYNMSYGPKSISVTPELYDNITDIDISISELEKARREAITSLTATNDYEKIKQLHDYLVKHNTYDMKVITTPGYEGIGTHSAYGALVKETSVCEGYAMAYKYLLNAVGIECEVVSGYANGGGHAWNVVKLDGAWYYVDTTWDDPTGINDPNYVRYNYFLVGSETLEKDHILENPTSSLIYPVISASNYVNVK